MTRPEPTPPQSVYTGNDPGLQLTQQAPATALATTTLDDRSPSEILGDLIDEDFIDALAAAVSRLVGDAKPGRRAFLLEEQGVTALEGGYASVSANLLRAPRYGGKRDEERCPHARDVQPDFFADALQATRALACDEETVLSLPAGEASALDGPLAIFRAAGRVPVVQVTLERSFADCRASQRRTICSFLSELAQVADVRLVGPMVTMRWLADTHHADLPGGVRDQCSTTSTLGPVGGLVDEAMGVLDPDGSPVWILRQLAAEPSETLSYDELDAEFHRTRETLRGHIKTLSDLGLVESTGSQSDRLLELTAAGSELTARYDAVYGRQSELGDCVCPTPKPHPQAVLPRARSEGGKEGADPDRSSHPAADSGGSDHQPYRTRWLNRPEHDAAVQTGESGGVTFCSDGLGDCPDEPDHTRYVSVDADRREVVAAVRAAGPLQHMVSVALAFASSRVLERVLPEDGVSDLDEPPAILRDARCIGKLPDEALEDRDALQAGFREWADELSDMTTALHKGEYDDRNAFRRTILRSAHGLAGSLVHLFDVLGYDVVREVRVPGGLDEKHLVGLSRSVAVATAIQSRYGAFASYRQLFERRPEKRTAALSPEIDAADPTGRLVGSVVLRGPDIHRLESTLTGMLESPGELHEEAPEFQVPVPITEADRAATERVTRRVLSRKAINATAPAVAVLDAVVDSPYDVARALWQLGRESRRRDIRPDDLQYALSTLPAEALLSDLPPTLGAVLKVLLQADTRLSQSEVADRADVSTQSVRTHRETLAGLGLVEVDDSGSGVSLTLTFGAADGDRSPSYPAAAAEEAAFAEVVDSVASAVASLEVYLGPVYDALAYPAEPWRLLDEPDLEPWVWLAARLTGADPPAEEETAVSFGPPLQQESLRSAATPAA